MSNVVLQITVPEAAQTTIRLNVPHVSMIDAVEYEIGEMARRQTFPHRYGMSIPEALSPLPEEVHIELCEGA